MKPSTQSRILDEFGKPIETKALDTRAFFGVDHLPSNWPHSKGPEKKQLLEEFKGLVYACVDLIANTACEVNLGAYFKGNRKARFPSKQLSGVEATKVLRNPYRKIKLRTGQTLQQLDEHPALQLLERPNKQDTQSTLFQKTYQHLKLTGEAYWYTPLGPLGTPVAIHFLNSAHVKPVIGDNNEVVGYEYGEGGKKETYSVDEIIPFIVSDPRNPHRGKSPLAAVYDALEIDEKLAATLSSILENNGRPDGILSSKEGISEDQAARWEHKFNAKFRRAGNGGVVVLDEDASFNPLTFSPRDMSWLPINEQTRLKICNVFHVPYALLDKTPASQYGVQATIDVQFVEKAVVPMLRLVQDALNAFFVPKFDDSGNLWIQFDDATPTNQEQTRLNVQAGITLPNEARAKQGLEPLPGGDQLAGMYSLGGGFTEETPSEPAPEAPESDAEAAPTTDATAETVASEGNLQASALNGAQLQSMLAVTGLVTSGQMSREAARITLEMAFPLMDKAQIAALVNALEVTSPVSPASAPSTPIPAPKAHKCGCEGCKSAILGPDGEPLANENQAPEAQTRAYKSLKSGRKPGNGEELAKVLKTFFAKQAKEVLGSLKKSHEAAQRKGIKADLPDRFVDLEDWDTELYQDSQPLIELYFNDAYKGQAEEFVSRLGISDEVFNVTNPKLKGQIKKLALRFCRETNATTSFEINEAIKKLRESFEEGLTSGERMSQLQDRVSEIFDRASDERAELIALTESARSHVTANMAAAKDSGVVRGSRVLLSSEACDLCREIAAQGEKELDDVWHKDDNAPDVYQEKLGPPFHPHCYCDLEWVLSEGE